MASISVEFLIGTAGTLLLQFAGAVWWISALQARVAALEGADDDRKNEIKDLERSAEKQKDRSDQVYNEVRAATLGIQKSIARMEGRLSISPRED